VAEAEFISVSGGPEDGDVGDFQPHDGVFGGRDGDDLAGDGPGILQSRIANIAGGNCQPPGDRVDRVERGQVDLLDFGVDVLAFAGGFVEGDLLNEEVFGAVLDGSADSGEVAS